MVGERLRCHYLRVFDLTSIKLLSQCHSGTEFTICMKRDKETICQILKTASRMRWTNHQSHSKQADDSRHTSEDLNNNFDTTSYVIPTWIKIALEYGQRVGTLQQNHESMLFSGSGENSNDGRHILEQKPTSLSFGESHVNFKLTEEEEDFIILANRFNCGRPDWVVATVALLTGKSTGFQILGFWERHAVSSYFWHRRNASSRHIVMLLQSIHVACEEHAPQVSVALRLAGLTPAHVCSNWLQQGFWNFFDWQEIVLYILGCTIIGPHFALVVCVAVLLHLQPRILAESSTNLDVRISAITEDGTPTWFLLQ
eukprot:gene9077-1389_t